MPDISNLIPDLSQLGGSIGSFDINAIIGKIGGFFNGLLDKAVALVPAQIMDLYNQHRVLVLLALVCLLTLVAFEGYRFFKLLTFAGSAFAFGLVGFWYVAPYLQPSLDPIIPDILDYHVTVAVICSLIAVLLCAFAFNFMIFILGAVDGFFFGTTVAYAMLLNHFGSLAFLNNDTTKYILGGIVALFGAMIFSLIYKVIAMGLTAFGGAIGALLVLQSILIPGADDNVKICCVILGIVLAIFALIYQHKAQEKYIYRL